MGEPWKFLLTIRVGWRPADGCFQGIHAHSELSQRAKSLKLELFPRLPNPQFSSWTTSYQGYSVGAGAVAQSQVCLRGASLEMQIKVYCSFPLLGKAGRYLSQPLLFLWAAPLHLYDRSQDGCPSASKILLLSTAMQ